MTCFFCNPPHVPEGETVIRRLNLDELCPEHRAEQQEALDALKRIHPDGHCTDTCGCMSLEELEKALDLA